MSINNCIQYLNSYADQLSGNPQWDGPRPHPLMFTNPNCSGTVWPEVSPASEPTDGSVCKYSKDIFGACTNPSTTIFSIYVPPHWQVTVSNLPFLDIHSCSTTSGAKYKVLPAQPTSSPVIISDTNGTVYDNDQNTSIVHSRYTCIRQPENEPLTGGTNSWKYKMCMNKIRTILMGRALQSYSMGSGECDEYMNAFCKNNLTHPTCSCLREEIEFKRSFCQPDNPNCTTNELFAAYIPVTCFGKDCSVEGYRFRRMIDQKCTITLCKQIVNIVGKDIINQTDSTLWCGNKNIKTNGELPDPTKGGQSNAQDTNKENKQNVHSVHHSSISYWVIVVIGLCVIALCVALPLAIITYKRARGDNKGIIGDNKGSFY